MIVQRHQSAQPGEMSRDQQLGPVHPIRPQALISVGVIVQRSDDVIQCVAATPQMGLIFLIDRPVGAHHPAVTG